MFLIFSLSENTYSLFPAEIFFSMAKKLFISAIFFFTFNFFSFCFSYENNLFHLWSSGNNNSLLFNSKLDFKIKQKNADFIFGADVNFLPSSLEIANTNLTNASFFIEGKTKFFDAKCFFSTTNSSVFNSNIEFPVIIKDFFCNSAGISFCMFIKDFSVRPFYSFSYLKSKESDFYYFYGKLKMPYTNFAGIEFSYKKLNSSFFYSGSLFDIDNYENENLIKLANNLFYVDFRTEFKTKNFIFSPFTGILFLKGDFAASLDSENQPYFAFPFEYVDAFGNFDGFSMSAGFQSSIKRKNWTFSVDLISLYFINQDGKYIYDYKYKKNILFDGSKESKTEKINYLDQKGIISINLKADYEIKKENSTASFFISKDFLIPLDFSSANNIAEITSSSSKTDNEKIISYLLSFIKIGFKVKN